MKKSLHLIIGILIGVLLFGGISAVAEGITANPTTSAVFVDGQEVKVDAYNIAGSNYFKLRDFCSAVDIGVWYDNATRNIYIETDKGYDANYTGPSTPAGNNQTTPTSIPAQYYYTMSGEKYHLINQCGSGTYYPCTLQEALDKGLAPCEKCVK